MDRHPRPRPGGRGDLRPGAAAAGRQQAVRLAEQQGPVAAAGHRACASCGYGYYRTTTTTTAGNKIYYYRCLGSDDYRYQGGRVCRNKPVRAGTPTRSSGTRHRPARRPRPHPRRDRQEAGKGTDIGPGHRKRGQLEQALAKTGTSINAMVTAFSEQLLTIDELAPACRPPRPRDRPEGPDSRPRRPGRRPRRLPQAGWRPRGLPRTPPGQFRHRNRRRQAARPACRCAGRPRRTREDHHPPPHPRPGTSQRRRPPRQNRHGG